jgi:hypothetical protein
MRSRRRIPLRRFRVRRFVEALPVAEIGDEDNRCDCGSDDKQ